MKLERKESITPICPHCKSELKEVWFREMESTFGRRYMYFCANCRMVLGISHRKGFWMG